VCLRHLQDTTVPAVERTLPWTWCADPDVLRREGERIFARAWQYVGHTGHVVASGSDTRETLQCPYHACTYGLDATLRAAPRSDREPGFDPASWDSLRSAWTPLAQLQPQHLPRSSESGPEAELQRVEVQDLRDAQSEQLVAHFQRLCAEALGS
jgi:hypothetical protein